MPIPQLSTECTHPSWLFSPQELLFPSLLHAPSGGVVLHCLQLAMMEAFTPWKLEITTTQNPCRAGGSTGYCEQGTVLGAVGELRGMLALQSRELMIINTTDPLLYFVRALQVLVY